MYRCIEIEEEGIENIQRKRSLALLLDLFLYLLFLISLVFHLIGLTFVTLHAAVANQLLNAAKLSVVEGVGGRIRIVSTTAVAAS